MLLCLAYERDYSLTFATYMLIIFLTKPDLLLNNMLQHFQNSFDWDTNLLLIINENDYIIGGGRRVYRCVCVVKFAFHAKASNTNI